MKSIQMFIQINRSLMLQIRTNCQ